MADRITVIPKKIVTVIEPHKSTLVDREKYRQTRVAAYCRVSTDSEEQLTSYKTQKKVYTDMIAARKDWSLVDIYADEGISGTLAEKRPRFKKMIEDCLTGKIDYIVTKSVSRFARNTVECLDYVRMLKSRGIGILFEEQNIDTLKSDSELYLVIYAGFAQAESESISKNITWSKRKNFEEGKVSLQYKKMLGYRKGEDGEPEIVPEEAKLVERIFDLYIAGETPLSISEMLQTENPTFDGKHFTYGKGMIEGILFNVKYCGDAILQQSVTVDPIMKKRKKNTGEALMYYQYKKEDCNCRYSDIGYPDKAESCIPRMGNRQRIKVCRLHSRFNLHRRGRCDALRNLAGTQLRFLGIRSGGYAKRDRTVRQNDRQVPTG